MDGAQVIIVGGGLAGCSAAHTVLQAGGRVVMLDKSPFLGGNSTKATSGINGAGTRSQRAQGIPDAAEVFEADTLKSAGDLARPALVRTLTHGSGPAVDWLCDSFDLDLSVCSMLGAHSFPRTHRAKDGTSSFPGMMITYRLIERLEAIADSGDGRARVINKARVTRLLTNSAGEVVGAEYEKDGALFQEHGPVVVSTGGFGADFTDASLLSQVEPTWRQSKCWDGVPLPPLRSLPTTNGPHCTGDGIKMCTAVGAAVADLHAVQVHPTGLVEPKDPDSKVKWLAAEALRGSGGMLLDNTGNRFADELGKRDYVTGRMWKLNKPPYRLILNSSSRDKISWHCEHYASRGLMKELTGEELAREIGCSVDTLHATFDAYNAGAAAKSDPFGKKHFNSVPYKVDDLFSVAIVTPVIHYTMGGVAANERAEALSDSGATVAGLFIAGEVLGGIHGANRLGGSSLLDCVVFGRVAGREAAKKLLTDALVAAQSGQQLGAGAGAGAGTGATTATAMSSSGGYGPTEVNVKVVPDQHRVSLDISWGEAGKAVAGAAAGAGTAMAARPAAPAAAAPSPTPAPAAAAAAGSSSGPKKYTMAEVAKHNTEDDCWVVVNGKVYDVTQFLDDHPGGKKTIVIYAGKDASKEFNMMHQPEILTKYGPRFVVGELDDSGDGGAGAGAGSSSDAPTAASAKASGVYDPDLEGLKGSTTQSWNSGGTAGELPAERAKATFDVEKLTNVLDGDVDATRRRRYILAPLEKMPAVDKHNMTRNELVEAHVRDFIAIHKPFIESGYIPKRDEVLWMSENATNSGSFMPHMGLFVPTILGQGSGEQVAWWLYRALSFEMVGSYAQTELGHGSNVRSLRTVATYDPKTEEFILNTPTLQSMKWWNSNIGLVATHAAVYAQLILNGKEYGVHVFMLQLRDEEHNMLPGIEVGDVGPKLGDHAIDTGYLRLRDVRIPREHLFSKRQHVEPDGTYVKHTSGEGSGSSKAHYLTMMQARAGMVQISGGKLGIAATIAARYSCVRRQGFVDAEQGISYTTPERQIIDYQMQQYRVFKWVSTAFAIKLTGRWLNNKHDNADTESEDLDAAIQELHASAAGLKGLCSYLAAEGIEDCRKCCGGHGYLLGSGVASLAADYVWQTTAEGDFIVMLLQTARFLIKSLDDARAGRALSGLATYLEPLRDASYDPVLHPPFHGSAAIDFSNLDQLLALFKHRVVTAVFNAGRRYHKHLAMPGVSRADAWNACTIQLVEMARSHCYYFLLVRFIEAARTTEDGPVSKVLTRLATLFALANIVDGQQWSGQIDARRSTDVEEVLSEVLASLRPDAVAIVDAFDYSDRVLGSALGRKDGNVYEELYRHATKSTLNFTQPFRGYKDYLQPVLDIDMLKTKNTLLPEARL